jgi:hypothetical protein
MKKLIPIIFFIASVALATPPTPTRIYWCSNPCSQNVTRYNVYDSSGRFVLTTPATTCVVPSGKSYFVTATNAEGESLHSRTIKL